ncbi:hypothetical protein OY671_012103, partial [Metschnikowia pulcherrima]
MPLAHECRAIAWTERARNRRDIRCEARLVPEQQHTRHGQALPGHPVEVWGGNLAAAGRSDVAKTKVVAEDYDEIGRAAGNSARAQPITGTRGTGHQRGRRDSSQQLPPLHRAFSVLQTEA